jgi:uncharacterized membrane protein YfcA
MPLPLPALLLAPLVVILAYIVLAVGGFGSALLSIPLLALLLPVKLTIPVVLIVDFIATLSTGMRFRRDVAVDEIKSVIPTMLLGLIAGVTLLVRPAGALGSSWRSIVHSGIRRIQPGYHERARAIPGGGPSRPASRAG